MSDPNTSPRPSQPPCSRPYWKAVAINALLELYAFQQHVVHLDEDKIHFAAARSLEFYRSLLPDGPRPGDPRDDIRFWREKMRRRLLGEEE